MMMPILDWTQHDVETFINSEGIQCHPWYYDPDGTFHVERRLGCIGCPLANRKHRIAEFAMYPNFVKIWVKAGQEYLNTHPNIKAHEHFVDAAEMFVFNLYCYSLQDFQYEFIDTIKLHNRMPLHVYLGNYFNIDLTEIIHTK